ncbi:cytochrome P450 [Talaromyces proteolyticus]|uniref:Cytochrome P450 n=1 Tax=Talaromyces proteolyticus TaxID=1131652 RepID=A0AAD4KHL6_9EURO|nr:cytochrome P450 [Talaromyces proteolyticus]KAH8689604.1 cytochrome P450 [Talaromyces proteolyticus]
MASGKANRHTPLNYWETGFSALKMTTLPNALTDFDNSKDRDKLPYIEAIIQEAHRWYPVRPMGFPHTTTDEDMCGGYRIPRGSILMPNVWAFTHGQMVYHDPMHFTPERFLNTEKLSVEPDLTSMLFGWGRRACPGRLVAESAMYLTIALFLKIFDIRKPVENGREINPVVNIKPGVVVHPEPFQIVIETRSPKHRALLSTYADQFNWDQSDSVKNKGNGELRYILEP